MQLQEYLDKNGLRPIDFASRAKMSIDAIYRYLKGAIPMPLYQEQIERITNGQVTKKDWKYGKTTKDKR